MTVPIIIAIDEGTTNAKAVCITQNGEIIAKGSVSLTISHPKAAWSEQDPNEIITAVSSAIDQALAQIPNADVKAIGISNQRESILVWERATGKAITPLVSWQCRRSAPFCETLAKSDNASRVQIKSGLPIDPLFPAAKLRYMLDNLTDGMSRAESGELCAGTVDTWLAWNLSGKQTFCTDVSNASRTQLFNIYTQSWDDELLAVFGIPKACLPNIMPSSGHRGETLGFDNLADGIPLLSQIGDSHAALYGQGGFSPGAIKTTYGTGSSLMTPIPELTQSTDFSLGRTVAWNDGALSYALEGNITHTGAGVGFMSKLLGISDLSEFSNLAASTKNNDGVYFVPALSGLGAPHWNSKSRGLITGLTDNSSPAILARAALEAIVFQVADVFYLMEKMGGVKLDTLLVDGGPTRNHWLMKLQANLLQKTVIRSLTEELSAMGAGYLAGRALGWWSSREQLASLKRDIEIIEPTSKQSDLINSYAGWKEAVERTLYKTN